MENADLNQLLTIFRLNQERSVIFVPIQEVAVMGSAEAGDEILLEVTPIGKILRVAALDPKTLAEVTFQAPIAADQAALETLARQKLAFVERRKQTRR
jgi:uncharacterized membrane protein YadS